MLCELGFRVRGLGFKIPNLGSHFGTFKGDIRVIQGYTGFRVVPKIRGYIGFYRGSSGIMEKKMEATI